MEVRSESGVFRFFRDLGSNALPTALEPVAVAVHLQDADVVGEAVQQRSGQALRPEDLEEEIRSGGGQGHEAHLVDDDQSSVVPSPHELVNRGRCDGEAHRHSALTGGQTQAQGGAGGGAPRLYALTKCRERIVPRQFEPPPDREAAVRTMQLLRHADLPHPRGIRRLPR